MNDADPVGRRACPGGCGQDWTIPGPAGRLIVGSTPCGCGAVRHSYVECLRCGHRENDPPCSGFVDATGITAHRPN